MPISTYPPDKPPAPIQRISATPQATALATRPDGRSRRGHTGHWGLRASLAAMAAFVAFTAIYGAIFVLPTMPREVLRQGALALFADYTIPALALGVLCGGSALAALIASLVWPRAGALAAVVAGAMMAGFEVVEIAVVGFTPLQTPDQFPAWLQVIYFAIGVALATLGARLWKAETGSYHLRPIDLPGVARRNAHDK